MNVMDTDSLIALMLENAFDGKFQPDQKRGYTVLHPVTLHVGQESFHLSKGAQVELKSKDTVLEIRHHRDKPVWLLVPVSSISYISFQAGVDFHAASA